MNKKRRQSASMKLAAYLSQKQALPSESGTKLKNLYQRCDKLTVDKLQDLLFDNDLPVLIIEGTATQEQLKEVWNNIYAEYCELSAGEGYNEIFEALKTIDKLRGCIALVDGIVVHLQLQYDSDLVNILNTLGLKCDIKPQYTGTTLINKLNAIIGRAKKWTITIQQREKDLDNMRAKNTAKIDRTWFDDNLDAISQFTGVFAEASKITVTRFFRTLNRINEHNTKAELKNHK